MADERFVGGDPYTDPQAQNVIDGSVDFFDFDWGDPVFHDEDQLDSNRRRRCVFSCEATSCGCDCENDDCDDTDDCDPDCDTDDCGCDDDCDNDCDEDGENCACGDNLPDQQDEQAYEIVEE